MKTKLLLMIRIASIAAIATLVVAAPVAAAATVDPEDVQSKAGRVLAQ